MQSFSFEKCKLEGLVAINPFYVEDERGFFSKVYEQDLFRENGIDLNICEENQQLSKKGVIRGLHFQTEHPQSKLLRVAYGEVYDVAVDLRKNSKTYGKWQGFHVSSENHRQLFIPAGFAHGFLSLSEISVFTYLCGDKYVKAADGGIRFDDPDIGVEWPNIGQSYILSEKDKILPSFQDFIRTYGGL